MNTIMVRGVSMSNLEPTLQEVIDIVDDINKRMPEALGEEFSGVLLTVVHAGYCGTYVKMFGEVLWAEEDDDRDYLVDEQCEEIEEKEDLKEYLEAQIYNICKLILKGLDV